MDDEPLFEPYVAPPHVVDTVVEPAHRYMRAGVYLAAAADALMKSTPAPGDDAERYLKMAEMSIRLLNLADKFMDHAKLHFPELDDNVIQFPLPKVD